MVKTGRTGFFRKRNQGVADFTAGRYFFRAGHGAQTAGF